jgi:cell division protein ZapA
MTIRLLDKEFVVACPEEEREALAVASKFLDGRMREVRDSGRVIGMERIAVITALNLANDLLRERADSSALADTLGADVRRVVGKLELALLGDSSG